MDHRNLRASIADRPCARVRTRPTTTHRRRFDLDRDRSVPSARAEGVEVPTKRQDSGLTPSIVEALKRKGYNQSQIAEMYGVTRQYVSQVKMSAGRYTMTPREEVMQHYPWPEVGARFHDASPNKRLRDHLEYQATGGKGMSENKLRRLSWFYRRLISENVVVEFDPEIPPSDECLPGGFAFVPRIDQDADLIIRVNDHVNLTERGKMLLRFPRKLPLAY